MARVLLVAACALIDADGRVLLAKRAQGKPMAGLWEFPGGKVHDGETPEAGLVRELREELGVETETSCLAPFAFASAPLGAQDADHLLMPLFVCRKWSGRPAALDAERIAWVWPKQFAEYDLAPADRPLAAQLRDFL